MEELQEIMKNFELLYSRYKNWQLIYKIIHVIMFLYDVYRQISPVSLIE